MTLRDLVDLARDCNVSPDAELIMHPQPKDKPRRVLNVRTCDPHKIVMMWNRQAQPRPLRSLDEGFVKLKGLGRYLFRITEGKLEVYNKKLKRLLKGSYTDGKGMYYQLYGKCRHYQEKMLKFFIKNPTLPVLCSNFIESGVRLSEDGELQNDFKKKQGYDVFNNIDDALETVILVKEYQAGKCGPMLIWLKEARINAIHAVTKFGHYGYTRVEAAMEPAVERFLGELDNFNVKRIMPLFAMLCKCLKVEVMNARVACPPSAKG